MLHLIPFLKLSCRAIMQKRLKVVITALTDCKQEYCGRGSKVTSRDAFPVHVCMCMHTPSELWSQVTAAMHHG
jgi:hypothetical protein